MDPDDKTMTPAMTTASARYPTRQGPDCHPPVPIALQLSRLVHSRYCAHRVARASHPRRCRFPYDSRGTGEALYLSAQYRHHFGVADAEVAHLAEEFPRAISTAFRRCSEGLPAAGVSRACRLLSSPPTPAHGRPLPPCSPPDRVHPPSAVSGVDVPRWASRRSQSNAQSGA